MPYSVFSCLRQMNVIMVNTEFSCKFPIFSVELANINTISIKSTILVMIMPTQKIAFIILFVCFSTFVIQAVCAKPVDSETYWLMVDSSPDADANTLFKSLNKLLTEVGKVSQENIQRLNGDRATNDEIENVLIEISSKSNQINTLIFLFHGEVSKQQGVNAMYISTQSEDTIQDAVLNQWLKGTGIGRILVIIDGYAYDERLTVYYANRVTLGTSALNVINPAETTEPAGKNSFLQALIDTLSTETIDTDDNRHISIIEIYQYLQNEKTFENAIFAPTGDVEETVMKLSPAIKVTSFPEGAQITLNDKENGETPKLFTKDLKEGSYTVSIKKAGYLSPEPKTADLKLTQGEAINFISVLKPISVYGTVIGSLDVPVSGTKISIDGTNYIETVGEDGKYSFQNWNATAMLTPGTDYTLYAKQGDFYHGSVSFTFDGYEAIEQPIELIKKTWFEIAELEFRRDAHQKAIEAFQNGIETTTDFPQLSEGLTVLLYTSFADAIDKGQVQDINYIVVTAKLAEVYQQPETAKKYWKQVVLKAEKGSPSAKLAGQRLWQMNPWRNVVNIGIACLLVIVIASGVWTFFRYRKLVHTEIQTETEIETDA